MTYTRQDLRLICELIEADLYRHTRYSQKSDGKWRAQDYTYTTKQVVEIIRKHLYIRPTEEELQGVVEAVKKEVQTYENCKHLGGRNAHTGAKKGNCCFLLETYCKLSNRIVSTSREACEYWEVK
jgi:TPP-dependent pyruvate/acetoin dehydrogenase alpha subunit